MSNRLFSAIAILVMGFLLFAFSLVQRNNAAILNHVAAQQDKILNFQQVTATTAVHRAADLASGYQAPAAGSSADVSALLVKISVLEKRIATLESDAKPIIDQVKAQQAAYEQQRKDQEEAMRKVYEIPVGDSLIRGNKDAPVTLVVFTDFQCPFCSRFHNVSTDLVNAYPDKVRFILKNYPLNFHQEAKPAAKVVLAAKEQGKYWEMVDAILEDNSTLNAAKYQELAKKIGLNVDKFNKDLKNKDTEYEKVIQDDITLANSVNVRGTPAFYLNGHITAPDLNALKTAVDEALKK